MLSTLATTLSSHLAYADGIEEHLLAKADGKRSSDITTWELVFPRKYVDVSDRGTSVTNMTSEGRNPYSDTRTASL